MTIEYLIQPDGRFRIRRKDRFAESDLFDEVTSELQGNHFIELCQRLGIETTFFETDFPKRIPYAGYLNFD